MLGKPCHVAAREQLGEAIDRDGVLRRERAHHRRLVDVAVAVARQLRHLEAERVVRRLDRGPDAEASAASARARCRRRARDRASAPRRPRCRGRRRTSGAVPHAPRRRQRLPLSAAERQMPDVSRPVSAERAVSLRFDLAPAASPCICAYEAVGGCASCVAVHHHPRIMSGWSLDVVHDELLGCLGGDGFRGGGQAAGEEQRPHAHPSRSGQRWSPGAKAMDGEDRGAARGAGREVGDARERHAQLRGSADARLCAARCR